jgi:hypothetical protein
VAVVSREGPVTAARTDQSENRGRGGHWRVVKKHYPAKATCRERKKDMALRKPLEQKKPVQDPVIYPKKL